MSDEISKSGVFIDTQSGKVVEQQPEEGIQLVPPGGVVTPDAEAQIKRAKAIAAGEGGPAEKQAPAPANKAAAKPPEK